MLLSQEAPRFPKRHCNVAGCIDADRVCYNANSMSPRFVVAALLLGCFAYQIVLGQEQSSLQADVRNETKSR